VRVNRPDFVCVDWPAGKNANAFLFPPAIEVPLVEKSNPACWPSRGFDFSPVKHTAKHQRQGAETTRHATTPEFFQKFHPIFFTPTAPPFSRLAERKINSLPLLANGI